MPSQQDLELARHAAAVLDHQAWRRLVDACHELTRGMTLDDIDAVAIGLERARAVFNNFPHPQAYETVH